jgi:hypothetical protein
LIFFSASLVSPFFTGRSNDLPTVGASIVSRQLASITLAAFLTAFAPVEIPTAQAKQRCAEAMPSNPQGHWWSYRLIDGRKCWYEGKPGLSKSSLEWPEEVSAQPASGEEIDGTVRAKPRNPVDSQAWAPNLQAWAPTNPDTFEARWRARALIDGAHALSADAASLVDARPATPEVDAEPHLKKADRLQPSYFDSSQAKVVRTLVIIPDQPHPAGRLK